MDDIIHLVATGGAGISAFCNLVCIWMLHHLLDEIAILEKEVAGVKEECARLDERTKWRIGQ